MSNHRTRGESAGRVVAADGALAITDADCFGCGTILVSSTTGTKAATFSFTSPADTLGGGKFHVYCSARSGGSYTIAATYGGAAGTVTIDAANECPLFQRIGSTLYCIDLGGSTHA